jgi:hypothetical protein
VSTRSLGPVWLANEPPGLVPDVTAASGDPLSFILVKDAWQPLAVTDFHGTWLGWLERSPAE